MTRSSNRIRRRAERVHFCDECSCVITNEERSRKLIEAARVRAIQWMGVGQ